MRRRRSARVRLAVALTLCAAGTVLSCSRSPEDAHDAAVVARVTALLHAVGADDPTAAQAVAALEALGPRDAAAVPTLMHALSCPPDRAPGAHRHDPPRADQHGASHASHEHDGSHDHGACDDHLVLAAARGLGAIGGAAVPPLLARLREEREPDRTFAGYAIARMAPAAAPVLVTALDDRDPRIRLAIIGAIRTMQPVPADALPAIAGRLGDADAEVRAQAADTLGRFGAAAVAALLPACDDPEPRVRASTASAFRAIGPAAREAAPALRAHLTDAAPTVRLNAAAALGAVGADDAATIAALARALDDSDHTVRWGAAQALGRLGPAAAAAGSALERARSDTHLLVRAAAADTLTRLDDSARR